MDRWRARRAGDADTRHADRGDRTMIAQIAPMGQPRRISSDSAWPLRRADGRTWAEARADTDRRATTREPRP